MMILPYAPTDVQYSVSSFFLSSKPIKHGQTAHVSWQKHGSFVRVLQECFNSFFKQSLTVLNDGRAYLVAYRKLRLITCSRCGNANFYVNIQTSLESEFLYIMTEKFVCPKCVKKDEK